MKVELTEVNSVKKRLKIEIPKAQVEQAWQKALQKIQKEVTIKGFRKGKVPFDLLEKQFAGDVQQEAMEILVSQTYPQALEEKKLNPISRPDIHPQPFVAGAPFSYEATFEIFPEVVVKTYKGLKADQDDPAVDPKEVQTEMKRLQASMTQLEEASEGATLKKGMAATIDFEGLAEGKAFEGSSAKGFVVDFGSGGLLEAFEKQLEGVKKGDKRHVKFSYPKDYFNPALAGKQAEFQVTVSLVHKKNVPELNNDFAKDLGNYETLKQVEEEIAKKVGEAKTRESQHKLTRALLDQLIEKNKFEIPESMVYEELKGMIEHLEKDLKQRGQKLEDLNVEEVVKHYKPEAEFRVRSFLICDSISKQEKFSVMPEEIDQHLEGVATEAKQPIEKVKAYYEKQNLMGVLATRLLHEKCLEFVRNQAKIKIVKAKS